MKWKEVIAEPDYLPLDTTYSFIYEIGEDTIVRGVTCKKVFINKTPVKQWVYEEGEMVWIITEDYTEPILIYDFNWHGDYPVFFEQLRFLETSEKRIERVYINQGDKYFDLTGRRLATPPMKGVYIEGGKLHVNRFTH